MIRTIVSDYPWYYPVLCFAGALALTAVSYYRNRKLAEFQSYKIYIFLDKPSNRQKLEALASAMENMGFAELVNEADSTYQVTNAFHYIEQIILCINIDEDVKDEIPQ